MDELPLAFRCNEICVVSDGPGALCGTAFTPFEHFAPWSVNDEGQPVKQPAVRDVDQPIMLLLHGMFGHARFLDLITGYVSFARTDGTLLKRLAKPHQYFAVAEAVRKTIEAVRGDGRAGVVWHTQGSGKSMEMELYANQILTHPSLGNPTIVVLTDRTDLDDQLFGTFQASDLLPEKPLQVSTRDELRAELANRRMGGIIFTTLQKFGKTKEERENGWPHPCCPTGGTSSSSSMRRTAPTTTTSTDTPATCATHCRTPRSSRSPAPRSPSPTGTPATSSASTSS